MDTRGLPGSALIDKGMKDLELGRVTIESRLVQIGAPRLRRLGLGTIPTAVNPERDLYELLAQEGEEAAHGRYNALVRELVSFERAAESLATASGA